MSSDKNLQKLRRIRPLAIENLDDDLAPFDPRSARPEGQTLAPETSILDPALFAQAEDSRPVLGCLLWEQQLPDRQLAAKLTAFSQEHDADIVVLSCALSSGFEKYGFRVERVSPDPAARSRQVEELRDFWGIAFFV